MADTKIEMKTPTEGDPVLFCKHAVLKPGKIHVPGPCHWYFSKEFPVRSDGRSIEAHWTVLCDLCHVAAIGEDIAGFIAQDALWIGEPPSIDRIQ